MQDEQKLKSAAKLVRAEDTKQPEVHPWQFIDLKVEATQEKKLADEEVYEKVRQELEPKFNKQVAVLKKEAFEEAKQDGFEEGYQAGFSTGQTQGLERAKESAQEVLQPQLEAISSILEQLARPQELVANRVFNQVAKMAVLFAEKLVGEAIDANPQRIVRVAEEAVALLPNPEAKIIIELNPEDVELVEYYQKDRSVSWELLANSSLARGSCKVRSLDTVVLDSWEDKLADMLAKTELLANDLTGDLEDSEPEVSDLDTSPDELENSSEVKSDGS